MQRLGPVLLTAAIALGACGSGDGDVIVADVWSRATAPTQTLAAVYFDLTVADDDTLVDASVPGSIAAAAEIHGVVMVDDSMEEMDSSDDSHDMHEMATDEMATDEMATDEMATDETDTDETDTDEVDTGAGQMTTMRELSDGLALSGGETVSFEPGGYHVMLPELTGPLEVGDEFELTLEFANAGAVTVTVEVAETAP